MLPILLLAFFAAPSAMYAHAFGQQFTLPLPVEFYIVGGVGAFIASCIVLLLFSRPGTDEHARIMPIASPLPSHALGSIGLAISAVVLVTAFWGPAGYEQNPVPNFFWIIFLLMFVYASAIVGGLWAHIDPFRRIASWFGASDLERSFPAWLPYIPLLFFFALLWLELFSPGWGAMPSILGGIFLAYLILCVFMARAVGMRAWFLHGEFFSIFFGLVGKVAPLQLRENDLYLAAPGERLAFERPAHLAVVFFIFIMLGSTMVDGLRESEVWFDALAYFNLREVHVQQAVELAALLLAPFLLSGFYALAIWCMKRVARATRSLADLCLDFAYSLVPIAIAYHFAHYFSLIASNGQEFLRQLSDPLGKGWDLFGTASREFDPGLIGADTVWYFQLGAIVFGHILAAIVAHRVALRLFLTMRQAVLSQLPMLTLMVFYTAFGLWTLAQPFML